MGIPLQQIITSHTKELYNIIKEAISGECNETAADIAELFSTNHTVNLIYIWSANTKDLNDNNCADLFKLRASEEITTPIAGAWVKENYVCHVVPEIDGVVIDAQLCGDELDKMQQGMFPTEEYKQLIREHNTEPLVFYKKKYE